MGHKLLTLYVTTVLITITACSSNGNDSSSDKNDTLTPNQPKIEQGIFLDGTVEGLSYRSGNLSGLTDANGAFNYEVGQDVAFFVGDIALGSAKGSPVVTPQQLAPEITGESINTIVNLVNFLLSIDEDANPDNGIRISATMRDVAAGQSIDFNQKPVDFRNDGNVQTIVSELTAVSNVGARTLIGEFVAIKHFEDTLGGNNQQTVSIMLKDGYCIAEVCLPGIPCYPVVIDPVNACPVNIFEAIEIKDENFLLRKKINLDAAASNLNFTYSGSPKCYNYKVICDFTGCRLVPIPCPTL